MAQNADQKTITNADIQQADDEIMLLKYVLKCVRKIKERKNNNKETQILDELEKQLNTL